MAKDAQGRPIPAYIPPPPDSGPQPGPPTAVQEQMVLTQQKTDAALRTQEDHARRIVELEQTGGDRLDAALMDFERRFNEMMERLVSDAQKHLEMLAASAPYTPPDQMPVPEDPTPEPHRHR